MWILAFSLGLAAVLTGLGLAAVYGRGLINKRNWAGRFSFTGTVMGTPANGFGHHSGRVGLGSSYPVAATVAIALPPRV